jgi:PIN domain nuclease of toxin-antitoxin system
MQNNLLDTHTFIWFINGDSQLSDNARRMIEKADASNYVSIASIWEIAIKISLGKLQLNTAFTEIKIQIDANNFIILPVELEHTLLLATLPFHHRDPFDRIIIAQAIQNDLTIISKDPYFRPYEAKLAW